jgi:hypothetical protein
MEELLITYTVAYTYKYNPRLTYCQGIITMLNELNRQDRNIAPDPFPARLMRGVSRGSTPAKGVKDDIFVMGG